MTLVEQEKEMFKLMALGGIIALEEFTKKELARYIYFLQSQLGSSNKK